MSTKELHDSTFLLDWDCIVDRKLSKKRLATHHYPCEKYTIDYAVPQAWLDKVANDADEMEYHDILMTVVWLYPDKSEAPGYWLSGIPAVLCMDTAIQLARLKIPFWTPNGYYGASLETFDTGVSASDVYGHDSGSLKGE